MGLRAKTGKGGLRAAKAVPRKGRLARGGGRIGVKSVRAMPKRRTARTGAKLGAGAIATRPYVQALMYDDDVRESLDDAYHALADAYGRISSRGDLAEAVLEDRRTRRHLKRAAHSMREATAKLRGAKARRRRRRGMSVVLVLVGAGGVAALALNEELRERLLALVRGSEETAPPQGSNGSQPTGVQPEGAPPTAATSRP